MQCNNMKVQNKNRAHSQSDGAETPWRRSDPPEGWLHLNPKYVM